MRVKLILQKSDWDAMLVGFVSTKIIEVEIPLEKQDGWQVVSAIWESEVPDD